MTARDPNTDGLPVADGHSAGRLNVAGSACSQINTKAIVVCAEAGVAVGSEMGLGRACEAVRDREQKNTCALSVLPVATNLESCASATT